MEEEIACLRKVFSIVRLVKDGEEDPGEEEHAIEGSCHCGPHGVGGTCEYCQKQIYGSEFPDQGIDLDFKIIDSHIYQVFAESVTVDGEHYILEMLKEVHTDDGKGAGNFGKLLTYEQKLYIDALTGAYNRRFFEDKIKNLTGNAGVALIDLDNLKHCNDVYGHDGGDAALKAVVSTTKKLIRGSDKLIRYGGDEFLLVMPNISQSVFAKKLRHIKEEIGKALFPKEEDMRISVSIGGAMLYDGNIGDVITHADRLMYYAKTRKNAVAMEDEVDYNEADPELTQKKPFVLIIDDNTINRQILGAMLEDQYRILEAPDGEKGLELLREHGTQITLVLLDIVMPKFNGFQVLEIMQEEKWLDEIPVIMISSESSDEAIKRAYDLGASDYISRPFTDSVVHQRATNMIRLYEKQHYMMRSMNSQRLEKQRTSDIMIAVLSEVVGFVNGESRAHVLHVSKLTELMLEQLPSCDKKYKFTQKEINEWSAAAALHDIGKIAIDPKILNKPGRLTKEEFEAMKAHTTIGAEMVNHLTQYRNESLVKATYQICRWHHERWDGRGYPDGLKGEDIPICAQVVSLADVYDALTSVRVYKPAFSHEKAMEMIQNGECGTFNPALLACLKQLEGRLQEELVQHNEALTRELARKK